MSGIQIVITKLKATSGVTSLVSGGSIYPVMWPQATQPPAVVVNLAGESDSQLLEGAAGYYADRVRVESMALDGSDAVAIGQAIKQALENVVKATIGGFVDVDILFITGFTDWADDRSMARHVGDYSVQYRSA